MHISDVYCQLVVAVSCIANLKLQVVVKLNGSVYQLAVNVFALQCKCAISAKACRAVLQNILERLAQIIGSSFVEILNFDCNRAIFSRFAFFNELIFLAVEFKEGTIFYNLRIKCKGCCCNLITVRCINLDCRNFTADSVCCNSNLVALCCNGVFAVCVSLFDCRFQRVSDFCCCSVLQVSNDNSLVVAAGNVTCISNDVMVVP